VSVGRPKPVELEAGLISSGPNQWYQVGYVLDLSDDQESRLPISGVEHYPTITLTDRFIHDLGHPAVSQICRGVLTNRQPFSVRLVASPRLLSGRSLQAIEFECPELHQTGLMLEDALKKGDADFCFPGQRSSSEVDSLIAPNEYDGDIPGTFKIEYLSIVRGYITGIQGNPSPQIMENMKIGK